MAKDTRWDQNLSVAPDACGLVGHAGAVLLRKLADQCGLTPALGAALGRKGKFPLIDRGMALVSMAVAIALGATSMSDIAVLAHQEPVLGAAPSDTTVRRTLELADARTLDKIARARAAVRAHVWQLICATAGRVPVAGRRREAAGGLAGHRPGRDADHRAQRQGRGRIHLQDGLRIPSARGLVRQYRRVAGDAAATGQRRLEHLRRSPRGADRGDPADPRPDAIKAAGPRRRGRRQPRAHRSPAVAVVPAPHCAVHLRLG